MDQELRARVCRLIAGLVVSDDDLDPEEEAFLDRVLAQFGVPADQRDTIFPIVDHSEAAETMRGLAPDVQRTALDLLVEATVADGKVVSEERSYLSTVAEEIGVSPSELEALIESKLAARAK